MEDDTTGLLGLQSQSLAQMPSDSLPFTVFIGSQVNEVRLLRFSLEFPHQILLIVINDVLGAEVILDIHTEGMLLEITHMTSAGHDLVIVQVMLLEEA